MATEKNISVTAQDQIDQLAIESAQLEKELAKAKLEAQMLELEDLKARNAESKQRREALRVKLQNALESDARRRENEARKQEWCNHSQGGEGLEGLYQGEGVQTTFQLETDSLGKQSYRCIRCEKTVAQADDPVEFARIKKLPHRGLRGPVPVLFKFTDARGNTVAVASGTLTPVAA